MLNQLGRCKRCGRPLKDLQSIQLGYGPKCWDKEQQEVKQPSLFDYQGQALNEYDRYQMLLNKQVQKELQKVLVR